MSISTADIPMRIERAEPILPARNLDETRTFYEKLGFVPRWGARGPWEYEIVSRGRLVVHFFAEPELTPTENDASCYWRVKDADRLYQEFTALNLPSEGIPRLTAPVDQPWGMREFALVDPSGNLVRVGHDLDADAAYDPQDAEALR
jgi:catechol 2,3-dioxygenase-like lactoylglutathione lyase family enzyme